MHHYPFHIGDYRSSTAHLSDAEDLAYRRLIDFYMDTEEEIPLETQWVARRLRVDTQVLENVLHDFFYKSETGWKHERCDQEIEKYQKRVKANQVNGLKGGRPKGKNPMGTQSKPKRTLTKNQEPITNKENKQKKFVIPTLVEVKAYCDERKNGIDAQAFLDHYEANGWMRGKSAVKDWKACVRTWERNGNHKPAKQEAIQWL
jgi:uncharacterized protein YdaU (DUF1376 family)